MRVAIMQPTYIPWSGYFNLMASADLFVFLDDVQYERSSWQNRNRVLVKGIPTWLTLPVIRGFLGAPIHAVQVDDSIKWRHKHYTLLMNAYARHPFVSEMLEAISLIKNSKATQLADLNIALLERICERLAITTPTLRTSSLGITGIRSERLISILEKLGATEYITPPGALGYLEEDAFIEHTKVRLMVHNFLPEHYTQRNTKEFVSHLSILDVVAHLGWDAGRKYIRPSIEAVRFLEEND